MTAQLAPSDALVAREAATLPSGWLKSAGAWLLARVRAFADYWEAATLYEQLSGLSDAELARRGLSRTTLARDVRFATDRFAGN
jgi:hypothetical protein